MPSTGGGASEPPLWAEAISLGDLLLRAAERHPEREALVFLERRFSYAEVAERAIAAARSLAGLGVEPGEAIGLLLPNGVDFISLFFGAQLLGAVVVPINTRFRARELRHVVESAGLTAVVTGGSGPIDLLGRLQEALPGLAAEGDPAALDVAAAPRLRALVGLGDEGERALSRRRFEELGAAIPRARIWQSRAAVRVRDVATLMFTSGTAAAPKGCLLSHEAMVRVWTAAGRRLGWDGEERLFDPLPMFHMGCLGPTLAGFEAGATLISMPHFEAGPALDLIERERATWLYTVFPTVTLGLIEDETFADRDLSRVRGLNDLGPAQTLAKIQAAFPTAIEVGGSFGMTEACGHITCGDPAAPPEVRMGTAGRPLPGFEVRAVDPVGGRLLGPGSRGELQVRGFGLFEGYDKLPEAQAEAWTEDGWLRSGDLGMLDEAGNVIYLGRRKDMLKVGGENVAPAEIEAHLEAHPAIKLAQVVAAPDPRLHEVPAAFVELKTGAELTPAELIEFCEGQIASFKVPRHVRFVSEWPTSATKIQKVVLRQRIERELAAQLPG
ncbi:MAG TPA: class I adenylate-forming enzyme family protein [Solirubrobacterales bacterium]|nr:class I adenylate-forming enzyme family protein [Solirubrobacterales bacterium]